MYGERDQSALEALLNTSGADLNTIAAVLLRVPQANDPAINKLIRQARVMDCAMDLAVAQLASPTPPKDVHQMMARNLTIAQQIQTTLEKLLSSSATARA